MANAFFASAKARILGADLDWDSDHRGLLGDAADDDPNVATDDFLDDIASGARVAVSATIGSPTKTDGRAGGSSLTFSSFTGDPCEWLAIYRHTGADSTSALVVKFDTAEWLPHTPHGGPLKANFPSGRIYAIAEAGGPNPPELAISGDGRYLLDTANGNEPFLLNSVAAWAMLAQLDQADTITFLDHCQAHGVNGVRCSLVEAFFSDAVAYTGENFDGESPWVGTKFQSAFNSAYWDHVEWVLDRMAERGIVMLAFPCYPGNGGGSEGWWQQGFKAAGASNMEDYGERLGQVLHDHPNAIIFIGGDYWVGFDSSPSSAANRAIQDAMVDGIKSTDRAGRLYSAHWDPGADSIDFPDPPDDWLDLNHVYYIAGGFDYLTHGDVLAGWDANWPTFFGEGAYKRNSSTGDLQLRQQAWRALCYGAFGHEFGDEAIWPFDAPTSYVPLEDWEPHLTDAYWDHMALVPQIMGARPWHLTAPDDGNVFVTSGKGSGSSFCPVRASAELLIGYCPSGATLTIARSQFSGNIDVLKIDPTNGSVTALATNVSNSGSTAYAFTGTNAVGDSDWIALVRRNGAT